MIKKTLIPDADRPGFLSGFLADNEFRFEALAYSLMDHYCEAYRRGYWHFYALSNGGMFMAPDSAKPFCLVNEVNYCDAVLSAEAAGIGVTLCALNVLCFGGRNDRIVELYYALSDFAVEHPERRAIFAFID